jgi:hypothetical protein
MDLAAEAGIEGAVYSDRVAAMLGDREAVLEASRQSEEEAE